MINVHPKPLNTKHDGPGQNFVLKEFHVRRFTHGIETFDHKNVFFLMIITLRNYYFFDNVEFLYKLMFWNTEIY